MLAALVVVLEGLFVAGAVLLAADHARHRRDPAARRTDWIKIAVYFALVHALLASAWMGRAATGVLFALTLAAGISEARACARRLPGMAAPALVAVLALGLSHAVFAPGDSWFSSFALLTLLVSSTDSFAQLTGRLWGRARLAPRISPAKTVEGWAGGLLAAAGIALGCGFLAPELPAAQRLLLGASTSLAVTAGDLAFSAAKRRAGIKDFSSLLPGHGGVLDRFDGFAFAAPVYVWGRVVLAGWS